MYGKTCYRNIIFILIGIPSCPVLFLKKFQGMKSRLGRVQVRFRVTLSLQYWKTWRVSNHSYLSIYSFIAIGANVVFNLAMYTLDMLAGGYEFKGYPWHGNCIDAFKIFHTLLKWDHPNCCRYTKLTEFVSLANKFQWFCGIDLEIPGVKRS